MVSDIVLPTLIIVTWWLPKVIKVIIKYHQIIRRIREAVPPIFDVTLLECWKGEGLVCMAGSEHAGLIPRKANFIGNMIINNGKADRSENEAFICIYPIFMVMSWRKKARNFWGTRFSDTFRQSQVAVFFHSALAVWVFGDAQMTGTKNFFFDTSEASSYVAEASKILGNQAARADIFRGSWDLYEKWDL